MIDAAPADELRAPTLRFCPACRAIYRADFERCPLDGTELATSDRDPLVGRTLADHYVIERLIGEGAMGRVYRAHHRDLANKKFAIKVLLGDFVAMASMRQRFAREAELASRLSHRNVVAVTDIGRGDRGLLFLVMDYVPGPTLADVITRDGALAPERVLGLARQITSGLAHAHELGLIHRDLKPDNLLLEFDRPSNREEVRIVDFGIAIANEPATSSRLTAVGTVNGTPAYAAPEQTTDGAVDARADLFALGVTLYEALTGVLPFDGTPIEIAYQNASQDPPAMAARNPAAKVPPAVERLVRRLMARRPADRFASSREALAAIDELHDEVRTALRASPPSSTTPPPSRSAPVSRTRRWPAWSIGVAMVALGAVGWWRWPGATVAHRPSDPLLASVTPTPLATEVTTAAPGPTTLAPSMAPSSPPGSAFTAPAPAPLSTTPPPVTTARPRATTGAPILGRRVVDAPPPSTPEASATPDRSTPSPTPDAATTITTPPASTAAPRAATTTAPPIAPPTATTALAAQPTAATPTALATSLGGWSIAGALPPTQLKTAVSRVAPSLRACGPRAGVDATYQVSFVIDEQRRARSIDVSGPSPAIATCLERALAAGRPAAPPDVGEATARFEVRFRQVADGAAP